MSAHSPRPNRPSDVTFDRVIDHSLSGEERRHTRLAPRVLSAGLAFACLLLAQLTPTARAEAQVRIQRDVPVTPARRTNAPASVAATDTAGSVAQIANVFGAADVRGDPSAIVRGVDVNTGSAAGGGKVAIATSTSGVGTPGRVDPGAEAGVGRVGAGSVGHTEARLASMPVSRASGLPGAGRRDAGQLGMEVRGRAPQMQSCYEREGLSRDRDLAGAVTLSLTIDASGTVSAATVARRSWRGGGAAETERCMVAVARRWRFGAAEQSGSYEFPFSFSSGR